MQQKIIFLLFGLIFCGTAYALPMTAIHEGHILMSIVGFFGIGVLLSFTPCVLPMVPILSGIIIGQEKISTLRALQLSSSFVLGMAITYALAGIGAAYLGSTLQSMLQQPFIIILFSAIFIFMAMSMFDLFTLRLPGILTKRSTKMSEQVNPHSLLGATIMGALSTLIASPCVTAPLISILSYIGQEGNVVKGGMLLFSLALGMGLPLILFAIGQGVLLPKTGAWMQQIKMAFGVMMLGLSIWMLSRLLPADLVMLLWGGLFIVSAIVFGALDFRNNRVPRFIQGVSFFALICGVMLSVGAASGNEDVFHPLEATYSSSPQPTRPQLTMLTLFTKVKDLPTLQAKLAVAKNQHQPVLIDFYASWCPVCRALDKDVFSDQAIQQKLLGLMRIRVDVSKDTLALSQIRERYHVYGVPSVVFYNKNGIELATDEEALTKAYFEQKLVSLLK